MRIWAPLAVAHFKRMMASDRALMPGAENAREHAGTVTLLLLPPLPLADGSPAVERKE